MAESAQVAEGDAAAAVDAVLADSIVGGRGRSLGSCLEAGVEGDQGGTAVEGAMRALLVVVAAKGVELELEHGDRGRRRLFGEEPFEGLVEAFDLAAGLGVVGSRVLGLDAQELELGLEDDLAAAGVGGEDGSVVGEQRLRETPGVAGGYEAVEHVGSLESGEGIRGN